MNEDDELLDQESQGGGRGGGNPISRMENGAKNVQNAAQKGANIANKSAERYSQKALNQTGKKAVQSKTKAASKKKMAENLTKVASKAGKVANIASKIGPIIASAAVFIIIAICIIGLIVFIITGLGFIMSGLKAIASSFGNAMYNFFYDEGKNIPDEKIVDTMEYLEEMGYDLYGYGFVGRMAAQKFEETKDQENINAKDRLVEEYDIGNFFKTLFDVSNTADTDQYRNILAYLYSDNYTYLVRNNNQTLSDSFKSLWSDVWGKKETFGKGLISLYHDTGEIGKVGDAYASMERGYITADAEKKTLTVKKGWINTAKIEYSLDGWTGRYGMPLEFLLATHIATMAPDLSYKLATSFETEVQILLSKVETNIGSAVKQEDGTVVKYDDMNSKASKFWGIGYFDYLNDADIANIMKELNLKSYEGDDNSRYKCTGPIAKDEEFSYYYNGGTVGTSETQNGSTYGCATLEEVYNLLKSNVENDNTINGQTHIGVAYWLHNLPFNNSELYDGYKFSEYLRKASDKNAGSTIFDDMVSEVIFSENDEFKDNNGDKVYEKTTFQKYDDENGSWKIGLTVKYSIDEDGTGEGTPMFYVRCTITSYYDNADYANVKCSDEKNDTGTICEGCYNYVQDIYTALGQIKVNGAETYVPYIYQVKDHWFRDVYFTKDAAQGNTVVATDDEYEQETGERWTLYETYKDDAGNKQYELYVYLPNDDGNYGTTDSDGNDVLEFSKSGGKYIVCKDVGSGNGDYKLDDDGITYKKSKGGSYKLKLKDSSGNYSDYSESPSEFRVAKKAKTDDLSDWNGAYASELDYSNANSWKDLEIDEDSPKLISSLNDLGLTFQYQMDNGSINQTADAVRGETNATIKKLFLDEYYIYDGTKSTAELINSAKTAVKSQIKSNDKYKDMDPDDPDTLRQMIADGVFSSWKDGKIGTQYDGRNYYATIDELAKPISLTYSSLSAFSMLENMHTLDAEYIYHDFKELVVELDYFDKEDLVEAEDEVMMFPIAGLSAAGWPVARYDKSEDFYGTLIHSATDLKARRAETEVITQELINAENGQPEDDEDVSNAGKRTNSKEVTPTNGSGDTSYADDPDLTDAQKMILQAAEDVHYHLESNGFTYSLEAGNLKSTLDEATKTSKAVCCASYVAYVAQALGMEFTMSHGSQTVNENILSEVKGVEKIEVNGLEDFKSKLQPGDIVWRPRSGGQGHTQIFVGFDESGNFLWYNCGSESSVKSVQPYSSSYQITSYQTIYRWTGCDISYNGMSASGSSLENAEFEGYAGSTDDAPEYVLAPVTGEVIKYGTVKRTNIETGEEQDVGFIKIRILGATECAAGKECTVFGGSRNTDITKNDIKEDDATKWLEDKYNEKVLSKLGYDYFWEEYNDAGIAGNVLYIEGFDVEDILGESVDTSQNASGNITKLADYISDEDKASNSYSTAYTVPNLLDDKREFELEIAEAAKEKAAYTITKKVDGKERVYIKEGAVIGKTYSSDDDAITEETKLEVIDTKAEKEQEQEGQLSSINDDSNSEDNSVATKKKKYKIGNYMRVILRDNDDEVVENVEDYVETPEANSKSNSLIDGETFVIPEEVLKAQDGREITFEAINRQELGMTQWSEGTVQKKLWELWVSQGSVATDGTNQGSNVNEGLAIININGKDYVPIALKSSFGKEGDYIQLVFENGEILDCIMMDAKGSDDGSYMANGDHGNLDYGHSQSGNDCNVLEVLVKGTGSGKTYGSNYKERDFNWWGKKVTQITNGGSIYP